MIVLFTLYWFAVLGLFIYGLNCYVLLFLYRRGERRHLEHLESVRRAWERETPEADLPTVTVQLPIFNERFVVPRLIESIMKLDWPHDRLEIQVLDDSTDDTHVIAAALVERYRKEGFNITLLHRDDRSGFKAGALREGMANAGGDYLAIFDADFLPRPDFLRRTLSLFGAPDVGLVQARWGHVNDESNFLTRMQAVAIDGHFGIEQAARRRGGLFLNFNGTGGVWRREAIEAAGGWSVDTLTEDLDLSYRAQLAGWRIEYAVDVEVPAELPTEITAFKSQQRRWAKGSIQTACKLLGPVFRSDLSLWKKFQAVLHLTHYLVHPLMLCVAILSVPLLASWEGRWAPLPYLMIVVMILLGALGPSTLYVASQRALRKDWKRRIVRMPYLMLVGTGIALSNTRAVLEALLGIQTPFVRTPKRGDGTEGDAVARKGGYHLPNDPLFLFEGALSLYCGYGLFLYLEQGKFLIGPFLALYTFGFGLVAIRTAWETVGRNPLSTSIPERLSETLSALNDPEGDERSELASDSARLRS